MIFSIDGNTIDVNFMVDFRQGGVDQRIYGPSTSAPPGKPKDNSHRGLMSVWAVQP